MTKTNVPANANNLLNLLEVIDLVLKHVEVRSKFHDVYSADLKNLYKRKSNLGKRSANLVNDCLQSHHYDEAAKLLWVFSQDRTGFEISLYKGIMVVLENLQVHDKNETTMKFCRDIQDLRTVNKLDVQLEYILYALRNNDPDIKNSFKEVISKRQPALLKKTPYIQKILSAYCALLDYITWQNICEDKITPHAESIADKAVTGLKSVINHPGMWDVFVLKLIEILEHYERYEEIDEVLKKYVEHNPQHINAYIYLCVHLHKRNSDAKEFIQYSKVLAQLCPSEPRVLLLVDTWNELGKKLKERLKILFMFLDYPINGGNVLPWQMLSSHLSQAIASKKSSTMETVKSSWSFRCHVWKYLHFNSENISSDVESNPELVTYKVKVLSVLEPGNKYIKVTRKKFSHLLRLDSTEEAVSAAEKCQSFYRLDDEL